MAGVVGVPEFVMRQTFEGADTNGDHKISMDEFKVAVKEYGWKGGGSAAMEAVKNGPPPSA